MRLLPTSLTTVAALLTLPALSTLAGCGTDPGDGGTGPGGNPAIAIAISPTSLTIEQGGSGTVDATITRSGGFSGAVSVTTTGAPAGVSAAVTNVSTSGGTTTGTVTVVVGSAVAPGTYPITITASGSGVTTVTASLSLTVTAMPAFALSVQPSSVTIAQGASGTAAVTIARTNFTGAIALTIEGAPTGVGATASPASTTGTTATITLDVGAAVTPGTYALTVRGTATGPADQTASLSLIVTMTPQGSYTLSTTPPGAASLQQGGSASVSIGIDRSGGYGGPVDLAVSGAPSGLGATISPTSTTGTNATLMLTATAGLAPGNYPLTITGTASGLPDQTVALSANVTAMPSGGAISIDFTSCAFADRPIWFAYQDGMGGPWTSVTPVGDVYTFDLNNPFGGFAFTVQDGAAFSTAAWLMHRSDLALIASTEFCDPTPGKAITGTVTHIPTGTNVQVSLGGVTAIGILTGIATADVSLFNVPDGVHDLVGYVAGFGVGSADRIMIRRDQDLPDGGSFGVFDATGSESAPPASAQVAVSGLVGGETTLHGMLYHTTAACTPASLYGSMPVVGNAFTAYGAPAAMQRADDYHGVSVTAFNGAGSRTVTEFFHDLAARSVALPSTLPMPVLSILPGSFKRLRFEFTIPSELDAIVSTTYTENERSISIVTSGPGSSTGPGYFSTGAIDVSVPDFAAVPGFDPSWAPATGATADWATFGVGFSGGGACHEGGRTASASRLGTI